MVTVVTTIVKCGCSPGGLGTILGLIAVLGVLALVVPAVAAFLAAIAAIFAAITATIIALTPLVIGLAITGTVGGTAMYVVKKHEETKQVTAVRQRWAEQDARRAASIESRPQVNDKLFVQSERVKA